MQIPPTGSPHQPYGSSHNPVVDDLNKLWDNWYDHPTEKTGKALLKFIQDHRADLEKLAKNNPNPPPAPPHGPPGIEDSCNKAEEYLQGWLDHGCDPNATAAPSEFVSDIAAWVNYAK